MALQQRTDAPGLAVQRRVGQMVAFYFSIEQIGIGALLGLLKRSPPKDADDPTLLRR